MIIALILIICGLYVITGLAKNIIFLYNFCKSIDEDANNSKIKLTENK